MRQKSEYWLSYSGYATYKKCPKKYRLTRIDKEEPPEPESKHNAVVGSVVQRVFEDFYNEELWRAGPETSKMLLERVDKYFYDFVDHEHIDWESPSCRKGPLQLLERCKELILPILGGIKREGLLGPYARSEVKLRAHLTKSYFLFGQIDFLIRDKKDRILLVDGKASEHREKWVDPDQLTFYALAFKLVHDVLPHRLGFYYFSFAHLADEAFDWYTPNEEMMKEMELDLLDVFGKIQSRKFPANPKAAHCKYCPYERTCAERQKQIAASREKRRGERAQRGEETLPSMKETADMGGKHFVGFGGLVMESDDE